MNNNILFIHPDSFKMYEGTSFKNSTYHLPSLALATLGSIAEEKGFHPYILDFTVEEGDENQILESKINELKPRYVAFTSLTNNYCNVVALARFVKENFPDLQTLIGGHHTSIPETINQAIDTGYFDYVFTGEAEKSFSDFLSGMNPQEIEGIAYKKEDGSHSISYCKDFVRNFDDCPMPAYHLFDLKKYPISRFFAQKSPVVFIETSRGCPFKCYYCHQTVHGKNWRPKSPERVIHEIEFYKNKMGIEGFFISDDGFTTDMKRAAEICDLLIEKKMNLQWSCMNGIRTDRVDADLVKKMSQAGCYRVAFGIETGNQEVSDKIGKRIKLNTVDHAVRMTRAAGIEAYGFFMLGLMDDTKETMQQTIDFAKKLPLDLAKASILMPFPGSPLWNTLSQKGLLNPPGDYGQYNFHLSPKDVYKHPTLEWDLVEEYYDKFFRAFYLNPGYVTRRFINSIKNGNLLETARMALSYDWFGKKKDVNIEAS